MFQVGDTVRLMDCWGADTSVPARHRVITQVKYDGGDQWVSDGTGWELANVFELVPQNERVVSTGENNERLVIAARNMLDMYKRSHDSGDWGNWDLEEDQEYVALRSALAKIEQPPARQG